MTGQLESRHFFRAGDLVRSIDGRPGVVAEAWTHSVVIEWSDGARTDVEQFDETVVVEERKR
jgi:hypothetical protein